MTIINTYKSMLNSAFPALRQRNFRNYWAAMSVSLIGTWMQTTGQSWLVYTLTKSAFWVGLVVTLQFTPAMLFSLFAGAFIDKLPKRKILIYTQTISMALALVMAVLVWTGTVRYGYILVLATALGLVNTLDVPTRQSFIIELAGREHLMNAIALNSSIFNAARIVGPALSGMLMGYLGIAFCFFANAISFVPIIFMLFYIKTQPLMKKENSQGSILQDVKQGLAYIFNNKILYNTILSVLVMGVFAANFNVLVPVFANKILHQGGAGFGLLLSAMGIGSLTGAMTVAVRSRQGPKNVIMLVSSVVVSIFLIITGCTGIYFITAASLAVTGFFNTAFFTTANSTLQVNASDEFRGRVTSIYTFVFQGSAPLGSFIAGSVAGSFGIRAGFITCGAAILFFVMVLSLIRSRSRDYKNVMEG